jgi:hypothetical protein
MVGLSCIGAVAPIVAQPRTIDTQRSTITVRVFKSGLFRAFADNHVIQAPLTEGALDDGGLPRVEIGVDARHMRVVDPALSAKDRQQVQARMLGPEVLDTARFPYLRFRSAAIKRLDAADRWLVQGDLELHGQIHEVTVKVGLDNNHYRGSATVKQSDFGIAPISIAGGAVKVKDEVTIDFDIVIADR